MTEGERLVWAVAFVEAYQRLHECTPSIAAEHAWNTVVSLRQAARLMPGGWGEDHEAVAMVREMTEPAEEER